MHIHLWAFVIKKATFPVMKPPKKHCCQNITVKSFLFQTMWCVVNAVLLCHHHRTEHFNFSTRRSEFTSKTCICCIPASKSPQEITGCTGFWHFGWHTLHWDCEGDVSLLRRKASPPPHHTDRLWLRPQVGWGWETSFGCSRETKERIGSTYV